MVAPIVIWSPLDKRPRDRDTTDPLGLHALELAAAGALVPGFSRATRRARSLSLLLAGVRLAAEAPPEERRTWFARFERLCVHHVARSGPARPAFISSAGIRAAQLMRRERGEGGAPFNLDESLTSAQFGTLWSYRTLASTLGLLRLPADATGPVDSLGELTARGEHVVYFVLRSLGLKANQLADHLGRGEVDPSVLDALTIDRACTLDERKLLIAALRGHRTASGEAALKRLAYDVNATPATIDKLVRKIWSHRMRALWTTAGDIALVVDQVENRFRTSVGRFEIPRDHANHLDLRDRLRVALDILVRQQVFATNADAIVWAQRLNDVVERGGRHVDLLAHHRAIMSSRGNAPWDYPRAPRGFSGLVGRADASMPDESDEDDDGLDEALDEAAQREVGSAIPEQYDLAMTPAWARISALLQMTKDLKLRRL